MRLKNLAFIALLNRLLFNLVNYNYIIRWQNKNLADIRNSNIEKLVHIPYLIYVIYEITIQDPK